MRACRFSSVRSGSRPSKTSAEHLLVGLHRRLDRDLEQLDAEVGGQRRGVALRALGGVARRHRHAVTRSAPSASTAISSDERRVDPARQAEQTRLKPFFST